MPPPSKMEAIKRLPHRGGNKIYILTYAENYILFISFAHINHFQRNSGNIYALSIAYPAGINCAAYYICCCQFFDFKSHKPVINKKSVSCTQVCRKSFICYAYGIGISFCILCGKNKSLSFFNSIETTGKLIFCIFYFLSFFF